MNAISFGIGTCVALLALSCSNARKLDDGLHFLDEELEYNDVWEPFTDEELGYDSNNFYTMNADCKLNSW